MADWYLDEGYHLDEDSQVVIEQQQEFSVDVTMILRPLEESELELVQEYDILVLHSVALDLLQLIPEKFRSSQILIDYIDVTSLQVGDWLTKVRDIVKLLNPNTVGSTRYIRELGALIGVDFSPEDTSSEKVVKKQLRNAIDWYKVKGTYQSVQILALVQEFAINIYDMYTNDYSTFYMVDWFVGDEDENPPGFDSSYYKSPHFGLEILLDKVYSADTGGSGGSVGSGVPSFNYLWRISYLDNFYNNLEKTRPVHTVPHYILLLNPKTDEFGNVITVDGEINTKVTTNWQFSTKYFDMSESGDIWDFDDGTYFDQSAEAFIKSITKYVFGTGNYPCNLNDSVFSIESPVLSGAIDPGNIVITDDKITFEFIVPKGTVQSGISSLGLYIPGTPDQLVLGSCFPKIDKGSRVELRVKVEVYKKSLL